MLQEKRLLVGGTGVPGLFFTYVGLHGDQGGDGTALSRGRRRGVIDGHGWVCGVSIVVVEARA